MSDVEIAWVAALLEGEGSFTLRAFHSGHNGSRGGTQSIGVTCAMTDEDVISKLHNLTGVGNYNPEKRRHDKRREHAKPLYVWSVTKRADSVALMEAIRPHMGLRRGSKIDSLLQYATDHPMIYNINPEHGDRKRYRRGCRCEPCVKAGRAYANLKARDLRRRKREENTD